MCPCPYDDEVWRREVLKQVCASVFQPAFWKIDWTLRVGCLSYCQFRRMAWGLYKQASHMAEVLSPALMMGSALVRC